MNLIRLFTEMNLANKITVLRIALVFPVLLFLAFPSPLFCFISAILFTIAAISDILDGYYARRDKTVSTLGKFLDPLADKLLICSTFIMLTAHGWIPAWISILIIMREFTITGLRAIASDEGIVIAADKYGKLKTIFQIVALIPIMIHYPIFGLNIASLGYFILAIALVLTLYSGFRYLQSFYHAVNADMNKGGSDA